MFQKPAVLHKLQVIIQCIKNWCKNHARKWNPRTLSQNMVCKLWKRKITH